MPVQHIRKKYREGMDYKKQKSTSANQGKKQNKVVHSQVHKKKDPPMLVMDGKTGHCHFVPAEEVA
jgi:hypothetical protein